MNNIDKSSIKKILAVRNDNIGDVICTTPCFEALRLHFPDAYIAVLVCRLAEDIVTGNPYLDHVFVYDKAKHGRHSNTLVAWWKQAIVLKEIREQKFDLAIGIRSDFSSSQGWLVYASGARYRLGVRPEKKDKKFSFFYNIYTDRVCSRIHEVERSLQVLNRIGVDIPRKRLALAVSEEMIEDAARFLGQRGIDLSKPIICVNISSRREENRYWESERYRQLIELSLLAGMQVIVTTGPSDIALVPSVLKGISHKVPVYSGSLKELAAVVSLCTVFVTVQGGPMHLAAATGVATIALFGKEDPAIWGPWGPRHTVIKKNGDINEISPAEVFFIAEDLIRARPL
ncbi:MAG: glycosyltransferase family 9 protein [Pseudomonadota bacterium]